MTLKESRQLIKPTVPLYKRIDKKQDITPLCGFDIETRGLGGDFIIGGFYTEDSQEFTTFLSLEECLQYMLQHPNYRYLSHNASGYEFAYLYPLLKRHFDTNPNISIKPTIQGESRIVQFVVKETYVDNKGKTKEKKILDIRDSLALFNDTLARVADAFCPDLPKGEPGWNEEHDNFDPTSQEWLNYLKRDCEIMVVAYRKHANNIWESFHSNLGVTAGSTAMRAFITTIPDGYVYYRVNPKAEKFFREGYYGAAVFPGHEIGNWGNIASVDINGAYGYQMKVNPYPTGTPIYIDDYVEGMLGIYRCIVNVPKSIYQTLGFNPLPHKTSQGLIWDTGIFETVITSMELEYAVDHGITVSVLEGYVFEKQEYIFKKFIDTCQELEIRDNGILKPSTKLLRNCCYGKFGTKNTHNVVMFSHDIIVEDSKWIPLSNEDTGEIIKGVYIGEEETDSPYIMPHWAAFITAYQRLYLFKFIEECYRRGAQNVYCDTDSIKSDTHIILSMIKDKVIPIGKMYGEFKLEEICEKFLLRAPKTFYAKTADGKEIKKGKGTPKSLLHEHLYDDAMIGKKKQQEFYSVQSVMRLIKQDGGSIRVKRKRTLSDIMNSYAWEIDQSGKIFPHGYLQYQDTG